MIYLNKETAEALKDKIFDYLVDSDYPLCSEARISEYIDSITVEEPLSDLAKGLKEIREDSRVDPITLTNKLEEVAPLKQVEVPDKLNQNTRSVIVNKINEIIDYLEVVK